MSHGATSLKQFAARRFARSQTPELLSAYPYNSPIDTLGIDRKEACAPVISFAHYDYLGLSNDSRVLAAAHIALDRFGVGTGASRLVGGELSLHRLLESELADFLGVRDVLALVSGYGTNVAVLGHLLTRDDLILVDQSSHNSIFTGCELSRAKSMIFPHNNLDELAVILRQNRKCHKRVLVVVEGLYSMDGDIPDLPRLIELCRRHDVWLMVDEAHSIGVLGDTGRGVAEHFGIEPSEIDIIVGTLSKSFVTCGGFIAGNDGLIDWLRCTLPGYVYSVGLPPPMAAAAHEAIRITRREPERLVALKKKSNAFLEMARNLKLNTGAAVGIAVVPVHFETVEQAVATAKMALAEGFFVPAIAQIAVPKDLPRLRFFLTKDHDPADMERVLNMIRNIDNRSEASLAHRPTAPKKMYQPASTPLARLNL